MAINKKLNFSLRSVIICIGTLITYVGICALLFFLYKRAIPVVPSSGNDIAQVILNVLSNSVTIWSGLIDIVATIILWRWKQANAPRWEILVFSVLFFLLVLFNSFALAYPLSSSWIVLIDSLFFVIGVVLLLLRLLSAQAQQEELPTKGKMRIIGSINNRFIVAEQVYTVKKVIVQNVTYTFNSIDYRLRNGYNINGILSVTYSLPYQDDATFTLIRSCYLNYISDGSEETKTELIKLLKTESSSLIARLKKISSAEEVQPKDCCTARILMIYLAFLRRLDSSEGDYIGELSLGEGQLGIPVDIEVRLFTLLRTGLLGAILLGPEIRYCFSYRKSGYKAGRKYSTICLPTIDGSPSNKVCLFALENISTTSIPSHVIDAIREDENRITTALHKMERGE